TPDGNRLSVAAGTHYYYDSIGGTARQHTESGADAAGVAGSSAHGTTIAGFSNGFFGLYNSDVNQANPVAYQKKEPGETTAMNAVAIRRDATAFATGAAGGTLRYYALDPSAGTLQPTLVASKTGLGAIHAVRFSGDGRYLAVQSGSDSLRLYRAGASLDELWHDTHAAMGPAIGIDERGEHVAA